MDNDLNEISPMMAYLLAGGLLVALIADIRSDLCRIVSGRNVVLVAIAAWYLLEAIMVPSGLRLYSQVEYDTGIIHVALAAGFFLLGYHFTRGTSVFPSFAEKVAFFDDETWLWRLVLIGAAIGFAPVVYNTGTDVVSMIEGMMGMRASWGGVLGRGRYGDARAAFLMLEAFVAGVSPFAAILFFSRNSTWVQRAVCGIVVAWPLLRAFGSATRSSLLTSAGAVLAILYFKASPAMRKKIIIGTLLGAPLIYGLMAAIVESRGSGKFAWENREKADYVGNEMFRELLFITSKVPKQADYFYGYLYYVQLVNPIPRFLWPEKPTLDAGLLMAQLYGAVDARTGHEHLTVSPGLIGEMYLNFGIFGIIGLSAFGGWLVKGWDAIKEKFPDSLAVLVYYSAGLAVLFIMGRSFTMNMFYGLLSLALLAWVIQIVNPSAAKTAAQHIS